MHIAILVTNTDRSDFAASQPRDPQMFREMLEPLRPAWTFSVIDLTEGEFPDDPHAFDGIIVTGSPASVREDEPWIGRLMELIRRITAERVPLFGACFGHQAVAQALGGDIGYNPGGWTLGVADADYTPARSWLGDAGRIALHAAHKEQVLTAPPGADVIATSPACPVGALAIGDHVFTTQHHPEIKRPFMSALIDEMEPSLDGDVAAQARDSLAYDAENRRFAKWVVDFFEQAVAKRSQRLDGAA